MPLTADELVARLLHRDANVLIIDKPAGLPVHGGPRITDHLERHLDALRFGLPQPPRLAHRLDRDTSGCLALGRHPRALARLGRLFAAGKVEKIYWALCEGVPADAHGTIDLPLAKREHQGGWRVEAAPDGQPALTHWRVLAAGPAQALIEFRPTTGRTHQIRVHAAALGTPVMGDPFYGRAPGIVAPMQLHARTLRLPWSEGRAAITATAPLPPHLTAALARCGLAAPGP
jgi:tRNA pseudouridine32 synthase/23S rRNA pseudouridine746 synthase